jgi:vitamin K-dependent gamma-carboxylase
MSRLADLVPSRSRWLRLASRPVPAGGDAPRRVAGVAFPRLTAALLAIYATLQLALPLRSYFLKEPSAWSGRGFNLAWRVMIAEKTGVAEFYASDPATGRRWKLRKDLTRRQEVMMAQDPYLVRALARRLSKDLQSQGHAQIQVKVDAFATLNGRPSQRLIDSDVDLAGPVASGWILALKP